MLCQCSTSVVTECTTTFGGTGSIFYVYVASSLTMEAAVSPKHNDTFIEMYISYCTVQLFAVIVRQLLRHVRTAGISPLQALQYFNSRSKGTLCILERVEFGVVQFACYVVSPFLLHFMSVRVGDYSLRLDLRCIRKRHGMAWHLSIVQVNPVFLHAVRTA